jgi:predicted RNA-binding protein with PUA-like domain
MNFWIFKSNPDLFKLDDRLQDPEPHTTWKVSRYKDGIQIGDLAFIWRTGPKRGVVGVIQITSTPKEMYELEHEQKYWENPDMELITRVKGNFIYRCPCISHKELKQINGLKDLSVFHGYQQQTNFSVTEAEGNILIELVKAEMKYVRND